MKFMARRKSQGRDARGCNEKETLSELEGGGCLRANLISRYCNAKIKRDVPLIRTSSPFQSFLDTHHTHFSHLPSFDNATTRVPCTAKGCHQCSQVRMHLHFIVTQMRSRIVYRHSARRENNASTGTNGPESKSTWNIVRCL